MWEADVERGTRLVERLLIVHEVAAGEQALHPLPHKCFADVRIAEVDLRMQLYGEVVTMPP
jgi:hypothetical protein